MKCEVTDRTGGPRSSPALDRNLLLVAMQAPQARLTFATSCQRVGEGSGVGSGVGWLIDLCRGVGGLCCPVSSPCLFTWCCSGNNES